MAHPFFDNPRFPWHRAEAKALHDALSKALSQPARIDVAYKQSAENLRLLALGNPPDIIWKEALENLAPVAGALKQLCEYLLADATLLAYHDRIRAVVDAAPALEERIISDYVVILDRLPLREKLALLEPDASPVKVLLVRGEPRSGKSHGRYLFERSARDQGALPVYLCEGIVATVDDVVRELFSALDASSEIPPRLTTEDAWYRVVCSKLRELASSKQRPLWIAVDDLGPAADGGPLLDSQIKQFCDQMALNMVNPAFRQWFRLMLIHYPDGQVPTRWKRDFWTEDRTNPMDVRQADVEVLLREWSSRHETIIEDELTTLAAAVLARADAPETPDEAEAPRLQRLHDALVETLNTLAGR